MSPVSWLVVVFVLWATSVSTESRSTSRDLPRSPSHRDWSNIRSGGGGKPRGDTWRNNNRHRTHKLKKPLLHRERKPNIIVIITDDQDIELGSVKFMPKALSILQDNGVHFPNAYVTTPMCCPSRSSILTGMYVHNHNVFTNNDNCSSPYWQTHHETRSFATYLNNAGYRTGYFGKYLNEYNGTYIPPGWREWAALIRNSRFYNYTVNVNGKKIKHGDVYSKDYYPDLITNDSLTFLRESKQYFATKPVMMVLSYPSPHGPEDAAPQYQHLFLNNTTHRTPNWNYAPNPDKQWILRHTGKMEPIHIKFTDMLQTKRLQTLQSVDEGVDRIYKELVNIGEADNTYIIYLSDHGYHLGQFGLVKGKAMPFEFDVKVPFYIYGPRVPKGIRIPNIVLNVDLAPTLLDIAGVEIPEHMDGKSILKLLLEANDMIMAGRRSIDMEMRRKKTWRDSFLIESAGRRSAGREQFGHHFGTTDKSIQDTSLTKYQRLNNLCQSPQYKPPCQPGQKWECYNDGARWRIFKCRSNERGPHRQNCVCPDDDIFRPLDTEEKNAQRRFIKDHVKKGKRQKFKPKFLGMRETRSVPVLNPKRDVSKRMVAEDHEEEDDKDDDVEDDEDDDFVEDDDDDEEKDFDVESIYQLHKVAVAMEDMDHHRNATLDAGDDEDDEEEEEDDVGDTEATDKTEEYTDWEESTKQFEESLDVPPLKEDSKGEWTTDNADIDHKITERSPKKLTLLQDPVPCSVANATVNCSELVYRDPIAWRESKDSVDDQIKLLKDKLDVLKDIRVHLKKSRPSSPRTLAPAPTEPYPFGSSGDGVPKIKDNRVHHPLGNPSCTCAPPFGTSRKINNPRDELREERRRQKEERLRNKERKNKKKAKYFNTTCNAEKMNCFTHDNNHWKTPPLWGYGPFCFCQNANNNTYWCLRTINETHNFLFCEFVTGFIMYFDLTKDLYQMHNIIHDLHPDTIFQLRNQLLKLRMCEGAKQCTVRSRPPPEARHRGLKSDLLDSDIDAAKISKHSSSRFWGQDDYSPHKRRRQNG